MKVSTVPQMRALDKQAIEEYGVSEQLLMENAGIAAFSVLLNEFGIEGKCFLVFAGVGNNGGDGCVLARKIHSNGGLVKVFILGNPDNFKGSSKINFEILSHMPIEVQRVETIEKMQADAGDCDLIVDAIFGTGLSRDVGGVYREVIQWINASGKPVLSIDIPSGVHGDTGKVMGTAVKADYTITFGLPKIGSMLYPGYELGGKLYLSYISFPPTIYTADSLKIAISSPVDLPARDVSGHKGGFGEALFIAGAPSYFGAPYFCALSYLKAGGGYSRLAAPETMTPFIANKGSEIVFIPQKTTSHGSISLENKQALLELAAQMGIVVLGPGLSLELETQKLARELASEIDKPLLIDGDGITALCADLQILRERNAQTILTPHLGEMSSITGLPVSEIDLNKIEVLQRTAADLDALIVLKGAHSLIGYPDQRVFINMSGNSGMAMAGSGDVLTGTIAAMFSLGLSLGDAVRQGVFVHGVSGDLAADERGEDGITTQDILDYLPLAMKIIRGGLPQKLKDRYVGAHIV